MSQEETKHESNPGNDLLSATLQYARKTTLGNIIGGLVIIILALQVSGLSIGTITDKFFGLQTQQVTNDYNLQLKTIDLIEIKVIWRLDSIDRRLDAMEKRADNTDSKIIQLEKDMVWLYKTLKISK